MTNYNPPNRLKELRETLDLSLETIAEALETNISMVQKLEKGERRLNADWIRKFAAFYGVNEPDILNKAMTRLVGRIGAGGSVMVYPDSAGSDELDPVEAPPGVRADLVEALLVEGNSMYPAYQSGDIVFYKKDQCYGDACIGKECVVLTEDGLQCLKIVQKGSATGLYTLVSHNAPQMFDQKIVEAKPIIWVKKKF